MIGGARHPVPRMRSVLVEQIRFLGLTLRRDATIGAAILLLLLVIPWHDEPVNFSRDIGLMFAALGFMAPVAVWKGLGRDERRGGYLWTLPVDHRRQAFAGVAAGWFWLMVAAAVLLLWWVALILLTGGHFGAQGTRMVLSAAAGTDAVDPRDLTAVAWSTPRWLWLIPFTAATIAYLLGSALVLGVERLWRWVGGFVLIVFFALLLGREGRPEWLNAGLEVLTDHPAGLSTAFAGGPMNQSAEVLLTTGETIRIWRDLPSPGRWAAATLLWIGIGFVSLWLATLRYREQERYVARATGGEDT